MLVDRLTYSFIHLQYNFHDSRNIRMPIGSIIHIRVVLHIHYQSKGEG